MNVRRRIYSLWLQGINEAPGIVRLNFERWLSLNPDYEMQILDEQAVQQLVSPVIPHWSELAPQALSDVVRTLLLLNGGGVWVDASVYPSVPLRHWLPSHITSSGFFAFARPGPDRPISSWFLVATPENPMMKALASEVTKYWAVRRSLVNGIPDDPVAAVQFWPGQYPYFWFHYLFQLLLDRDRTFSEAWANCVQVSAEGPHLMQGILGQNPEVGQDELREIAAVAPVHKLDWRQAYPLEALSSID